MSQWRRRVARFCRRLVTVPLYVVLCIVLGLALPILLPVAWLADRLAAVRRTAFPALAYLWVYLACETCGIVACALLWRPVRWRGERFRSCHYGVQRLWAAALFGAAQRLFSLRLIADGVETIGDGPILIFMRHASLADTLLPAALLGAKRFRLRYVLKQELLWDPCLDIVGNRLPNVFVRRGSGDTAVETSRIAALAAGLGRNEGVVIWPEGTRFTQAKLERALAQFVILDPQRAGRIGSLRHVLPVRYGGVLALLAAAPTADVLFFTHTGLEKVTTATQLWNGVLRGGVIRVALRRVPRAEVPADPARQAEWLDAEWQRVDWWITRHHAGADHGRLVS